MFVLRRSWCTRRPFLYIHYGRTRSFRNHVFPETAAFPVPADRRTAFPLIYFFIFILHYRSFIGSFHPHGPFHWEIFFRIWFFPRLFRLFHSINRLCSNDSAVLLRSFLCSSCVRTYLRSVRRVVIVSFRFCALRAITP